MSYTVRAAATTAVSASISTPVWAVVSADAVIDHPVGVQLEQTSTLVSGSGWHSGHDVGGVLGRHDAGDLGDRQHVALGQGAAAIRSQHGRRDQHSSRARRRCGG